MKTLSVFCYVKNEQASLNKSLESIRSIADQLVVVDTGSTDETLDIAYTWADKVIVWPWQDNFATASNFAASLCHGEYLTKWDADWVLREGDATKVMDLKKRNFDHKMMAQFAWISEFYEDMSPVIINRKGFAYQRDSFIWKGRVHDYLTPTDPHLQPYFEWHYDILNQTPDTTISRYNQFYPDIWVYHYKDKVGKPQRYSQTNLLIEQELTEVSGKDYVRLVYFAVSGCVFAKDYAAAERYLIDLETEYGLPVWAQEFYALVLFYLEKFDDLRIYLNTLPSKTPQLALIEADLEALFDPPKALSIYQHFEHKYRFKNTDVNINYKRMIDHPKKMIEVLSKLEN